MISTVKGIPFQCLLDTGRSQNSPTLHEHEASYEKTTIINFQNTRILYFNSGVAYFFSYAPAQPFSISVSDKNIVHT